MSQSTKQQIIELLDLLEDQARDGVVDSILSSNDALKDFIDQSFIPEGLHLSLAGVDCVPFEESDSPLTVYIWNIATGEVLKRFDPIGWISADGPNEEWTLEAAQRAIQALQSGMDRLKAYEAKCIQARS